MWHEFGIKSTIFLIAASKSFVVFLRKIINNGRNHMNNKPLQFLDPKADIVFKKIFGQHPELVKSFLNGVLPLPEGRLIESIAYLTPEQSPRIPDMKTTIVDVKCTDQAGRIFIVEMQMEWNKDFLKRFLFGTAKAFVQQMQSGDNRYHKLCPVYGLAILNEQYESTSPEWFHHYRLVNINNLDKALEGLELVFLELPKFRPQTFEHRKVGALWLRFLRDVNKMATIPQEFWDNPEIAMAIELTQESSYTRAELEVYDRYLDYIRIECARREASLEEGEKIGLEKMARKMLAKGMSIKDISELTGLSGEEVQSFLT